MMTTTSGPDPSEESSEISYRRRFLGFLRRHSNTLGTLGCLLAAFVLAFTLKNTFLSVQHLQNGLILVNQENYPQALKEFTEAVSMNPNAIEAIYQRGCTYSKMGDWQKALADYNKVLTLNPFHKEALIQHAIASFKVGDFKRSVSDYNTAFNLMGKPPAYLLGSRANVYTKMGSWQAAIKDYTEAIVEAPKNASFYSGRAACYGALHHYLEAIHDLNSAAALNSRDEDIYLQRGLCYQHLAQYPEALQDFDLAIAIAPDKADGYIYRGYCYSERHDFTKASENFEKALKLNSNDLRAYDGLAHCSEQSGQLKEAINNWERALNLGGQDGYLLSLKCARAYLTLGDYNKAITNYTIALQSTSADGDIFWQRAKCYAHLGNYAQAEKDCDQAIHTSPSQVELYLFRASCLAQLGQDAPALSDYEKALKLNSSSVTTYIARGSFYNTRKRFAEACDDFRTALHLDPNLPEAKAKLAYAVNALKQSSIKTTISELAESPPPITSTASNTNLNSLLNTGYRQLTQGKVESAVETLGQAVRLSPNDPKARRYLAYALLQAGEPQVALEQFKHLNDLGGQTIADQLAMADAFKAIGQTEGAIKIYNQCIERYPEYTKAYLKLALTYSSLGISDKAVQTCVAGIRHTKSSEEKEELELLLRSIAAPQANPTQQVVPQSQSTPPVKVPVIEKSG